MNSDAVCRAMEQAAEQDTLERLSSGKKVHWHKYTKNHIVFHVSGPYRIACFLPAGETTKSYIVAFNAEVLDTLKSMKNAKLLVATHATWLRRERENQEARNERG